MPPPTDRLATAIAQGRGHSGRRFYRALPAGSAVAGIALGGLAIASALRGAGPSPLVGAICVVLLGAALWMLRPRADGPIAVHSLRLGQLCAAVPTVIALVVAAGHWWSPTALADSMASNTTLTVLLLGVTLLLLDAPALDGRARYGRARYGRVLRWACNGTALLVPWFASVGYLFDVRPLYDPSDMQHGMALDTALALAVLAMGTALARPARGVARLLAGEDAGALLLRRALPVTVFVPVLFGWLRVRGEELGLFSSRVGVAGLVLAFSVVMVTTFTRAGAAAYRAAADRSRMLAEREAAREALVRSEAEFREMADNLPQLAWIADETGAIFWYNRRWYDYTGTTLDQMQGWGWQTVHHPEHVERVTAGFRAAIAAGTPWEDTFPLRAATGEWRWFLSRANPIRSADRWFGTNTDITAQRTLEAEREQLLVAEQRARADAERASAEAAAASRAKSQFLATMSHELRTPLNAIAGHVQLVELGLHGPITEAQQFALHRAQLAQRHLLGLINDVLNLARIEAGRIEYRPTEIAIAELAAGIAPLIEPQLDAKSITFTIDVPSDHELVAWADREKTSQVLLNLLSNAAKFTETGGHVTLEARAEEGYDGPMVVLRVRDTGRGIPLEDRARIFEPFVQIDAGYAREQEGTGLGLAISRDLARGMHGDLTLATSAEGHGSVFALTLPRATSANPDDDRRTGEDRRDGERRDLPDRRTGEDRRGHLDDDAPDPDTVPDDVTGVPTSILER